jgi:predicted LPLAT superfamily acyltransferase
LNTGNWYQQHERGAGAWRLGALFWLYRIFGLRFMKFWVRIITTLIGMGAKSARRFSGEYRRILNEYQIAHNIAPTKFSPAQHIRCFADSLVDKMVAMCDKKNRIEFVVQDNADWREFQKLIEQKMGAFLICSHVGNIGALAAFPGGQGVKIHAFQQIGQTGVFYRFISAHSVRPNTIIHAVEDMSVATAGEMFDFLCSGDLVMMAGDRVSAATPGKTLRVQILGHDCELPMGVFRFARTMSHPVFAVALLRIAPEKYKIVIKKLDDKNINNMANGFAEFLEAATITAPTQWFNFYDFFVKK